MAKYRGAIHKVCHRCNCDHPGDWVRFHSTGNHEALCYTCAKPLYDAKLIKCIYWINKNGKEMFAPGA